MTARAQALGVAVAVAEVIRGAGSIPSGHLYAQVMGRMSLASYEAIIRGLKGAGLVSERAHMLTWTGPAIEGQA